MPTRKRELGRGERVVPGVWRLRLPLPWPGVPHCNAWAVAAGDGIVLFDTRHARAGLARAPRARARAGQPHDSTTSACVVCTHAHSDHYGQAADDRRSRRLRAVDAPQPRAHDARGAGPRCGARRAASRSRASRACPRSRCAPTREARRGQGFGISRLIEPDRPLRPGVEIATDLGAWQVYETPGHAPSHVCMFQPEHRLLISRRPPARPRLALLRLRLLARPGRRVPALARRASSSSTRACASRGHGRTFTDVQGHIEANRALVARAHREGATS